MEDEAVWECKLDNGSVGRITKRTDPGFHNRETRHLYTTYQWEFWMSDGSGYKADYRYTYKAARDDCAAVLAGDQGSDKDIRFKKVKKENQNG